MDLIISEKDLNEILAYLGGRPYAEVYKLIGNIALIKKKEEHKVSADINMSKPEELKFDA